MMISTSTRTLILLLATASVAQGFVIPASHRSGATCHGAIGTSTLRMNFFKDMLDNAFANDESLDKDKSKGQYDGPEDEMKENMSVGRLYPKELTETQKRWRETQQNGAGDVRTTQSLLVNSQWKFDLFLTGIASRDPSNDLFGSKVNISARDRTVGLMVPEEPTVSDVQIKLLEDGVVQVESDSEFMDKGTDGAWKLSDDGKMIRISLNVMGYQRTVETKGSIQKIFWSQEDDTPVQTSSTYTIPAGPMYGDATLQSGSQVGTLQWTDGVLRVEQSAGLLGAGSKMIPCGRFSVQRVGTTQNAGVV